MLRLLKTFALVAAAGMAFAPAAKADVITGLYNTGVDNSGVAVVGSQIDQHWVLGGGTAYTSSSSGWPIGGPWVADSSTSRWITPTTNAANSRDATTNGFYTYSLTFDLAANDLLSTAWFKGQFAADDLVTLITLNGNSIYSHSFNPADPSFASNWTSFAATGGFVDGQNMLSITVENIALPDHGGSPTGLDVQFTGSFVDSVPEPSTWLMMITGFVALGALAFSRTAQVLV
jgi:PEP-CTERM motif